MPTPPRTKGMRLFKINAHCQALLIRLLLEGRLSCEALAAETGLHYATVLQYCRELYLVGAAHIASWEVDSRGRDAIKVYRLGSGKDAVRHRYTAAQRSARHRKKRAATDRHNHLSFLVPVSDATWTTPTNQGAA